MSTIAKLQKTIHKLHMNHSDSSLDELYGTSLLPITGTALVNAEIVAGEVDPKLRLGGTNIKRLAQLYAQAINKAL